MSIGTTGAVARPAAAARAVWNVNVVCAIASRTEPSASRNAPGSSFDESNARWTSCMSAAAVGTWSFVIAARSNPCRATLRPPSSGSPPEVTRFMGRSP